MILCEWGYKRYLRQLVLWNLLFKGKGRIKRILRRLVLWILLEREKGETKEFRRLVLLLFWQREKWMKKKNSASFWTMNFSSKRKYWTKTLRKKLRKWIKNFCKKNLLLNSCHNHIFIITWWLKLKFVTLVNFFKTSHVLKVVTLLKTSHLKVGTLEKLFKNKSL